MVSSAVAFSAALGAGAASAADPSARPYTKAPIYSPLPVSWTGCYVGGNVGGGWDRFTTGEVAPAIPYGSNEGSSVVGGGQTGCDYQFAPQWVVGIQGQAEFGTINSSNAIAAFPGITAQFSVKNIETLTGRVGYLITPSVLAYAKGGAAWAAASGAGVAPALGGIAGETANFTMTGYTVGSGLEWMFAPGWSVFGEYNYINFGTRNVNFLSTGLLPGFGAAGTVADFNAIKLTTQTVNAGVNYKFNWGGPVVAKY